MVKFNQDHSTNPAHPPPNGGDGLRSAEIESVFEAWWERIGQQHLAEFQRHTTTATSVRAEIGRRIGDGIPVDALHDAIAAAADPKFGGKPDARTGDTPYEWLRQRGLSHTLVVFRGSFDKLVASARWHRQRLDAQARMSQESLSRSSGGGTRQSVAGGAQDSNGEVRPATLSEVEALLQAVGSPVGRH
ncbi:MAG: hypothetical protein ACREU5_06915 [Burkholderiales bacterium]